MEGEVEEAMLKWQQFEKSIKRISGYLTKDKFLQKDLCQEMRIYLWSAEEGHTDSYYLQGAKFKAQDYLKLKGRSKEVVVRPRDLERLIEQGHIGQENRDPSYYDSWHEVDKATEHFNESP